MAKRVDARDSGASRSLANARRAMVWLRAKAPDAALIVLGGALGTAARVGAGWVVERWLGHVVPGAIAEILLVNVSGSFVLGILAGVVPVAMRHRHPHWLVGGIGFLGAYTTFSSLAYGSVQLLRSGQTAAGLLYPLGSLALGVVAVGLGDLLGASIARQRPHGAAPPHNDPGPEPIATILDAEAWAEDLLHASEGSPANESSQAEAARDGTR